MSLPALIMMIIYLGLVGGGLALGIGIMVTHRDETAGKLG